MLGIGESILSVNVGEIREYYHLRLVKSYSAGDSQVRSRYISSDSTYLVQQGQHLRYVQLNVIKVQHSIVVFLLLHIMASTSAHGSIMIRNDGID